MSTHTRMISQCIKYHCVQSTKQFRELQNSVWGWGWGTRCFPTSPSLWGCALCKGSQPFVPPLPAVFMMTWENDWYLVGEWGSQGCQACIGNNSPSNTNCASVENQWKSPIPHANELLPFNFHPTSSRLSAFARLFLLPRVLYPNLNYLTTLTPSSNTI